MILISIGVLLIFLVTFLFYLMIIKPYANLQFYKKQGIRVYFNPGPGFPSLHKKAQRETGDYANFMKSFGSEESKPKLIVGNLAHNVEILLTDPDIMKEFFHKQDMYDKSDIFGLFRELMGEGLILAKGDHWKKHRKLVSMAFHYELLKKMIPDMAEIAKNHFEALKKKGLKNVSVMDETQKITGEVVGRLFFGDKFSETKIDGQPIILFLGETLAQVCEISLKASNLFFGIKFIKLRLFKEHKEVLDRIYKFRKFCDEFISRKMQEMSEAVKQGKQLEEKNMLVLFFNQSRSSSEGSLSVQEIIDEFATFFVAGMDTTAHLVTISLYYTLRNPQNIPKLIAEADRILEDLPNLTIEKLSSMDYTTAFLKESLRFGSPAPFEFIRIALQDHQLGSYKIKKGTLMNVYFFANNFDDRYHNDSQKFMPERWTDSNSLTNKSVTSNPFVFTPFSQGARNCIGQHLALNEARILLGLYLKTFSIEFSDKNFPHIMTNRFMYELENDLKVDFIPRV